MIVSSIAIILFGTSSLLMNYFGDIGIISLCYIGFMFATGMLTEVDFNSLSWHTLFLVGGGNVLGNSVSSSGLLQLIADIIMQGLPLKFPWLALFFINVFALIVSTFISHTVAAIILLPIIVKLGIELNNPIGVVVSAAFAISGAMALPFSSFPNVNSLLIVDDLHRSYLSVGDFIKSGLPLSIITLFAISTVGLLLINYFL